MKCFVIDLKMLDQKKKFHKMTAGLGMHHRLTVQDG
jgi:hypothetical protein